jgi:hypothetical protein
MAIAFKLALIARFTNPGSSFMESLAKSLTNLRYRGSESSRKLLNVSSSCLDRAGFNKCETIKNRQPDVATYFIELDSTLGN